MCNKTMCSKVMFSWENWVLFNRATDHIEPHLTLPVLDNDNLWFRIHLNSGVGDMHGAQNNNESEVKS